ncbi:Lysosome-associated membrane glycoprotein 3 [Myotis davidii]|uniref:Lysosome-associated membrane glycoprotein 3 n=1 Tax=Myotis davidii TaxID=225400 RepID=L5LN28_MYODS|nr:Lysosome-associated membrane glycoprotein 3 [Myotis davidii]
MFAAFTNRKCLVLLHFPKVLFIPLHSRFMKVGNNSTATVYLGRVPSLEVFQLSPLPRSEAVGRARSSLKEVREPRTASGVSGSPLEQEMLVKNRGCEDPVFSKVALKLPYCRTRVDECSSDYTIVLPVIGAIVLGLCAVGLIVYGIRLRRESSGYQRI